MAAENFKVKKGLEVGTGITANSDGVNVTGIVTATQFKGDGSGLTGVVASGTGVVVKDEGSAVGTAGTINFVGSGVSATLSAGTATVTINAGAGTSLAITADDGGNTSINLGTETLDIEGTANEIVTATGAGIPSNKVVIGLPDDVTIGNNLNVTGIATGTIFKVPDATNSAGATNHIAVGDSSDLKLYHDNNGDAYISNATGHLTIRNNTAGRIINLQPKSGANGVIARYEGAVELYHNGQQKLTTTINGIEVPDLNVTGVGTVGRLDTNGVVLGTNATTFAAKFADNAVANFGGENDLKISHNGSHAFIDADTGDLYLRSINDDIIINAADDVVIQTQGNESAVVARGDGTVELYFDGAKKFETDQAGVKITGVCTATSFSGSAAGLTNIPSAQLSGALPSLDGSALTGVTASGTGIVIQHDGSNVGTAGTINFSTNLDVSPVSAGIVTITASGGGGGSQNLFSTIAVSGQSNIVADGTTDTLTFAEGSNITLTTNAGTDTITIASEQRTVESIQDIVGAMFSSNTETDITATYQDDDGTIDLVVDLSSLNADNLDSGTIPNGRFPTTLPTLSGANLTGLNAGSILTGTLPIARIADNAVTFAKMQDVGTGVLIGRNDGGSGDMEALSASEVRTLLNVADGATAGGDDPTTSDIQVTYEITNQTSFSYFRFAGNGVDSSANNPDIYLERGQKYRFINNSGGSHPFQIQTTGGSAYNTGVTNNNSNSGNIDFAVRWDAPAQLKYQCTSHGSMQGNIYIHGANGRNINVGITSFTGIVVSGIATAASFVGSGANLTGFTVGQIPNLPTSKITSGTLGTDRIPNLAASKITSGTLGTDRIPNLAASKITSGTFDAARIPTLNQNTTGNAGTFTVSANNSNNETVYPVFVDGTTGSQGAETDTALSYNPSSNTLTTGIIDVGDANISSGTATISSAGNVDTTAAGSCSAIEYTIFASNTNSGGIQSQKVLVMDNGSTAYANEFAVMFSSSLLISFSADLVGAAVRLRGTKESGINGNISIKFIKTIIE